MGDFMKTVFACLAILVARPGSAQARDFGYEKSADVVAQVYGSQYGAIVPFFQMPDATDTDRQLEGYPGSVWNFSVARGRNKGTIYTHVDQYCNPTPTPALLSSGTTQISNWLYRTELSAGGDITVTGATPADVIFQLTAIDAKYITSFAISIANVRRYYLPYNILKDALSRAAVSCGKDFAYGLTGVIAGDVTMAGETKNPAAIGVVGQHRNILPGQRSTVGVQTGEPQIDQGRLRGESYSIVSENVVFGTRLRPVRLKPSRPKPLLVSMTRIN